MGGVGSVPKVCVDEHEARSHSRAHSADTVVSAGNVNGALKRSVGGLADRGDLVQQFVEHRRSKIRKYVTELSLKYPIPISCVVEASGRNSTKSRMLIQFACQAAGPHCVYSNPNRFFSLRTKIPAVWLHLMFLQQEAMNLVECGQVLTQSSEEFRVLDNCWSCLPKEVRNNRPFAALVTSAFPSLKVWKPLSSFNSSKQCRLQEQAQMLKELQGARYFDSFSFSGQLEKWICFSCANPDQVK